MIRSILCIIYNVFRTALGKLLHPGRFRIAWIQRLSPRCSLRVFGRGSIWIGRNCDVAPYCNFEAHNQGVLTIGAGCFFNRYCMISAQEQVTIGDRCLFGPGVRIFDNNHRHSPETGVEQALTTAPISIGEGSWIGSNVVILKGSRIGKHCVIGAGCIVHGIIPDGAVVVARQELEIR